MLENASRKIIVKIEGTDKRKNYSFVCGMCKHGKDCKIPQTCGVAKYISERIPVSTCDCSNKKQLVVTVPVMDAKKFDDAKKVAERAIRLRLHNGCKLK